MHAKPDLRVVLEWKIAGSGSVIADVIPLKQNYRSAMCATCVYFQFEDFPLDLDRYFTQLSRSFDAIRLNDTSFRISFSKSENVDIGYHESGTTLIMADEYNDGTLKHRHYIRPSHLIPLMDWHAQCYSVEPEHILGISNHYYDEFNNIYKLKYPKYWS